MNRPGARLHKAPVAQTHHRLHPYHDSIGPIMRADTVFALSSGPAPAGVAVIRLSGSAACQTAEILCGARLPPTRQATLRRLYDPTDGTLLDEALVLVFKGPHSFTGEDVVELHCHGGKATVEAVLKAITRTGLARLAEPGDFTRRAFGNGRMDLTEVEGLSDLIAAETEAQRRLALRQASGENRAKYQKWTDRLVSLLAGFEAAVDFPEDDLPDTIGTHSHAETRRLVAEWDEEIALSSAASALRTGIEIAIVGAPNAGKSTLLNALAGREAAIVSDIAGTTRDVLEIRLDLGGYPVTLADTAGIRDSSDTIEAEGVRRARDRAAAADIVLVLYDSTQYRDDIDGDDRDGDDSLWDASNRNQDVVRVFTKADHRDSVPPPTSAKPCHWVSAHRKDGLRILLQSVETLVKERYGPAQTGVVVRERHREALEKARTALARALHAPEAALAGEDIRLALSEMGRITGRVDVEAILDVVFSEFCIGK